jgi:hypothetical protein
MIDVGQWTDTKGCGSLSWIMVQLNGRKTCNKSGHSCGVPGPRWPLKCLMIVERYPNRTEWLVVRFPTVKSSLYLTENEPGGQVPTVSQNKNVYGVHGRYSAKPRPIFLGIKQNPHAPIIDHCGKWLTVGSNPTPNDVGISHWLC